MTTTNSHDGQDTTMATIARRAGRGLLAMASLTVASVALFGCAVSPDDLEAEDESFEADDAALSDPCAKPALKTVDVKSSSGLSSALASAKPGTRIRLAAGTYTGKFAGSASGTATNPIVLCGPRTAILTTGSRTSGYGFHLEGDHWILSGVTVKTSAKGIVLDGASDNVIEGVLVRDIGGEGVHFRTHSSGNILRKSEVRDVGKSSPGMGEAVYVGSAVSNWGQYTSGKPDKSDENRILGNKLGPNVGAELIDIKEGTTGTLVQGNTFDGAGMSGDNYADSWIDVKGNDARITGNTGTNALKDGFQTHVAAPGWGQGNVFRSNIARVKSSGYGFSVTSGNKVYCDNTVQEAGKGFANVTCTR